MTSCETGWTLPAPRGRAITGDVVLVPFSWMGWTGIATHPYRSQEAETVLRGDKIDEASAREAGEIALREARPLAMNKYKVDLAKVLVRRGLLGVTGN